MATDAFVGFCRISVLQVCNCCLWLAIESIEYVHTAFVRLWNVWEATYCSDYQCWSASINAVRLKVRLHNNDVQKTKCFFIALFKRLAFNNTLKTIPIHTDNTAFCILYRNNSCIIFKNLHFESVFKSWLFHVKEQPKCIKKFLVFSWKLCSVNYPLGYTKIS